MATSALDDAVSRSAAAEADDSLTRRVSSAFAHKQMYRKQAAGKSKVRRRVNFECVDNVILKVGDFYSQKLTLDDVKSYLDANDLLFSMKTLNEMWAEADFKRNGCLEPDELRAAVSGRYKHRRFNDEWVLLMCTLLKTDSIYYPDQRAVQEEKRPAQQQQRDGNGSTSGMPSRNRPNRAEGVKVERQGQSEANINESTTHGFGTGSSAVTSGTCSSSGAGAGGDADGGCLCFGFESQEQFRYYSASIQKLGEGPSHDDHHGGSVATTSADASWNTADTKGRQQLQQQWTTAIRTIRTTDKRDCLGLQIDLKPLSQVEREAKANEKLMKEKKTKHRHQLSDVRALKSTTSILTG